MTVTCGDSQPGCGSASRIALRKVPYALAMDDTRILDREPVTRRTALLRLGGLAAGAIGAGVGARELLEGADAEAAGAGPATVAAGLVSCVLTPELWHCDAAGAYSGVQGDTGRFLRGIQRTNAKGVAVFQTIYPGWYPGRTVHIHVKTALGGNVVHTGQLYFSDRVTDTVYRRAPYTRRPNRSTRNAGDSIYRNGGSRSTLRVVRDGRAYVGSIAMGVQRS